MIKRHQIARTVQNFYQVEKSMMNMRHGGSRVSHVPSSFVSEWMFSPDVVFFHGITEVFSYFQGNYFSAKDEYDKARNSVLVLLHKSLNRGQFF